MFGSLGNYEGGLYDELRRIEEQMNEVFGLRPWSSGIRSVARGSYPPINVGATSDQLDVYLFAAGLDPQTLDISVHQNLLTVAGERKAPVEKDANYYRKERYDGAFRRAINLPDDIDPDQVSARYQDGVLHIRIPRRAAARPRQIRVE